MADLTGHSLGRYQLTERLGQGGMATVYKAYDTRLETNVAVKVIRTERLAPDILEHSLKRFEREAKALARLTHANIVSVKDYGEYKRKPYLVMEYLPSGTLKSRLGKPMLWQEAVRILIPIARALDYAHRQNMIHRDVKPSNILITADGDPMLTDFGIAKILDLEGSTDLTGTGMGIGTPEYMAPEQWIGKTSTKSDQYALGVVLYEMVTGHKPYTADTPAAILLKQSTEPLSRPTQYAHVPDKVEKLLLKVLAKNPEDRYATMGEFAIAMEALLGGTTMPAKEQPVRQTELTTATLVGVEQDQEDLDIESFRVLDQASPRPRIKIPWMVLGGVLLGFVVIMGVLGWALRGGLNLAPSPTLLVSQTKIPTHTQRPATHTQRPTPYTGTPAESKTILPTQTDSLLLYIGTPRILPKGKTITLQRGGYIYDNLDGNKIASVEYTMGFWSDNTPYNLNGFQIIQGPVEGWYQLSGKFLILKNYKVVFQAGRARFIEKYIKLDPYVSGLFPADKGLGTLTILFTGEVDPNIIDMSESDVVTDPINMDVYYLVTIRFWVSETAVIK